MRHEYRVTKYDPRLRDSSGRFTGSDWISISDVGKSFTAGKLTMGDYLAVESAYLAVLRAMLEEAEVRQFRLLGLEDAKARLIGTPSPWQEGAVLTIEQAVEFAQLALREEHWGMLAASRRAYVHFGWDYYMYVGLSRPTPSALDLAEGIGIFVEPFRSPYSATARRTARRVARARST